MELILNNSFNSIGARFRRFEPVIPELPLVRHAITLFRISVKVRKTLLCVRFKYNLAQFRRNFRTYLTRRLYFGLVSLSLHLGRTLRYIF